MWRLQVNTTTLLQENNLKRQHRRPLRSSYPRSKPTDRDFIQPSSEQVERVIVYEKEVWKYTHSPSEKPFVDRRQGQNFEKQPNGDGEKY